MPLRPLDNWREVGQRVAAARAARGLTQSELADEISLQRTALAKVEAGTRTLSSLELVRLASVLSRPIESFVAESLPAVVSNRAPESESTRELDLIAQDFARDVQLLLDLDALKAVNQDHAGVPETYEEIEQLAVDTRRAMGSPDGPLLSMDAAAETLGLYVLIVELDPVGGEGAYVSLEGAGASVINGRQPSGRRRYTLAHEIGHHVMGDEYVTDWELDRPRDDTERRINAFAIHLLMPRQSIQRAWRDLGGQASPREAAIALAQDYRVSWSAVCGHLRNLSLIDRELADELRSTPPTKAEHLERGGVLYEDLVPPRVSPRFTQAALRAFRANKITGERAVELLRGEITEEDLPPVDEVPLDALTGELA